MTSIKPLDENRNPNSDLQATENNQPASTSLEALGRTTLHRIASAFEASGVLL